MSVKKRIYLKYRIIFAACFLFYFLIKPHIGFCVTYPLREEVLAGLNKDLINGGLLDYFKIREVFISAPYEELIDIQKDLDTRSDLPALNVLLDEVILQREKEGLLFLIEDIYIGNIPFMAGSPFYGSSKDGHNIKELKPHAERLYFENLILPYKKPALLKEQDGLWLDPSAEKVNQKAAIADEDRSARVHVIDFNKGLKTAWSYLLRYDHLTDYVFGVRQWIKKYEESPLYPRSFRGAIIMRNELRIFCIDTLSGLELWSFGNMDKKGEEFYQTFRHPHQNSYGYGLLIEKDALFTQLDKRLVALDLKEGSNQRLMWAVGLGEYTLCTNPVKFGDILIVGLINARMEFWVCGFYSATGALAWSNFIGTSSFLTPASNISVSYGNKLFLATNQGVILCLEPLEGKIIWLRKYTPKKYSIFDYWFKSYYKDNYSVSGSIKYDSQFLEIGRDGTLYYKSRESDYLYLLNPGNGSQENALLLDSDKYYILRAVDGLCIFLKKHDGVTGENSVQVVDMISGKIIYEKAINEGNLRGINYLNGDELAFKVADRIYFLRIEKKTISLSEVQCPAEGWLLDTQGSGLFVADGRVLTLLEPANGRVFQSKSTVDAFSPPISLQAAFPAAKHDLADLRQFPTKEALLELDKRYGEEIVTYEDIQIKFSSFLKGSGLLGPSTGTVASGQILKNVEPEISNNKNYAVKGEKVSLIPVNIIKGPDLLNFYLLMNWDQLLCIDEAGRILWARKIFYNTGLGDNYPLIEYETDKYRGRMYADPVQAYFYDGVFIINDHVNIVGVDAFSGEYLWSMSNGGDDFEEEKQILPVNADSFFKKYGVNNAYLRKIRYFSNFIGDELIVTRGRDIYSVNPKTGFCNKHSRFEVSGPLEISAYDGKIYILSTDKIEVLNQDLEQVDLLGLNRFTDGKLVYPELFFHKKFIFLFIDPYLYAIDRENLELKQKITIGEKGAMRFFSIIGDNLIVVFPFQRIVSYEINGASLSMRWESLLAEPENRIFWKYIKTQSQHFFVIDDSIIAPFKRGNNYYLISKNIRTGRINWVSLLRGIKGLFYNLSNAQVINGDVYLIISTVYDKENKFNKGDLNKLRKTDIDSRLFAISLVDGKVRRNSKLPIISEGFYMSLGFKKMTITETKDRIYFGIHDNMLQAESKHHDLKK